MNFLVSSEDYGLLANINGGYEFIPKSKEIFVKCYANQHIKFYYKDCEELIQDAHAIFPNSELSDEKKRKYFLE